MDYKEIQQKILAIVDNTTEDVFLKAETTATIERRQIFNTYEYQKNKKNPEKIGNFEKGKSEENKETILEYIKSCNDDNFLSELLTKLRDKMKKLDIKYEYDGYEEDDEIIDDDDNWFT